MTNEAPKTGTEVILYVKGFMHLGFWSDNASFGQFEQGQGWQVYAVDEDDYYSFALGEFDPTHWMPLPKPPEV